jgi:hypothetical protein
MLQKINLIEIKPGITGPMQPYNRVLYIEYTVVYHVHRVEGVVPAQIKVQYSSLYSSMHTVEWRCAFVLSVLFTFCHY